jgi:amino acid adenylation domain-containing protein
MTCVIDTYELSPIQAGMLFNTLSEESPGTDVEQAIAFLDEPLDEAQFLRALQRVADRHPVLRSRFRWEGLQVPVQDAFDTIPIPAERLDWRDLPKPELHEKLQALLDRDRVRGIDPRQAPLMRLTLARIAEREHWVVWTFHHAIMDGRAFALVLREVFAFYEAFLRREDLDLPVPRPYRDYIEWLSQLDHDVSKDYWQNMLSGYRTPAHLDLNGRQGGNLDGSNRGSQESRLSAVLTAALSARAREMSVTLNTLLQGAWALLLHHYTGEPDIVFGATRACRRSALGGADDMVGLLINTLPVRVSVDPEAELAPWLRQLRAQQVAVREYEHTPLVKVQGWSEVPGGRPLFESIMVFDNQSPDAQLRSLGGAWSRRRFEYRSQTNFPLTFISYGEREALLQIEYSKRRFADDAIHRMLRHLQILLEGMSDGSRSQLNAITLLTEAERHQLVVELNRTGRDYPRQALMQELFEGQARQAPEHTALRFGATALSYGELEGRANRIAQALRSRGVGRGQRVGLCVERGAEMLAAVLGILKAGAAYVPLDPAFPQERLRFMAEDAQLALLVSSSALAGSFGLPRERQLLLDADAKSIEAAPDTRLPLDAQSARPEDPAYVIYTSGSTGKPKGVVVPHRAVVNFLSSMAREPGLSADDVLVAVTTLSFDIAVLELQLPLTLGATVVIASREQAIDGHALKTLLEQTGATVMQATPVTWRLLLEAGWQGGKGFKALVGGEGLPQDLAESLIASGIELWNMYGPTETTVWSTCARITDTARGITIGKPIANTTVYILDAHNNLCPIGVPGELCIGGEGVTLGYWNRPELTAERFIPDPFSTSPGARLYRTGDRARWRNDGTLEHLGRLDFQVKIRGYRIELGEIETAIARHAAIREVVVVAREDIPGDQRLVAYLVAENPPADWVDQLRAQLRAALPEYMVPSAFVVLDKLPLTPNAKIDRKALPAPERSASDEAAYVAPRTPTEEILAGIWAEVLKLERVGRDDNFFELGGHSLLAMQVAARVRGALGVDLPLRKIFATQTIANLAAQMGGLRVESGKPHPSRDRQRIML